MMDEPKEIRDQFKALFEFAKDLKRTCSINKCPTIRKLSLEDITQFGLNEEATENQKNNEITQS